jgi:RNA polymerase subunit RPABC4/transcription elongation factor Spt4
MKLHRINTMYLLIFLIIGMLCIGEMVLNEEYKLNAKGDDNWIPKDLGDLFRQEQGMNYEAEVNHAFEDIDGDIEYKLIYITLYPQETNVKITLDVSYVKVGDSFHPVYLISYKGDFIYDNPANTTVYFPLPSGTITDLLVRVNGNGIQKPDIVSNQLKINLTEENSTMSVSFNSYGKYSYSHQVPKNIFVENFTLEIEILNVNDDTIDSERGESPNMLTSNGKSVTLTWDNDNTIMRENVVIDLKSETVIKENDPWLFFIQFFYGLIYLGPIICLFYIVGLHRIERDKKGENVIFLLLPYLLLCVLMGVLIYWIGILPSLIISVMGFSATSYIMEKRAIKITKGLFGFFLVPVLLLLSMIGLILEEFRMGTVLTLVSVLSLIGVFTIFLVKNPRQKDLGNSRFSRERSQDLKDNNGVTMDSVKPPPPKVKGKYSNKKFCPHCGFSVKTDYGFCPKCGKDISLLDRCSKCGMLRKTSDDALFCPNCGNLETAEERPKELKKRYFAKTNNGNQI